MEVITDELLNSVSQQAKENPRLRMNYNFHKDLNDGVHRLLNALEPDTYLPPHRHTNPDKDESYIILRGSIMVFFYDDEGNITDKTLLDPTKGKYGLEIPAGIWHSIVVLESNTVIYEIKAGPYIPLTPDNLAKWAPEASDKEGVRTFINKLLSV